MKKDDGYGMDKFDSIKNLAENAGYGFDKMFKGWRHHYSKDPVVSTGLDYYRIEFFFGASRHGSIKAVEKIPGKLGVMLDERLGENEARIFQLIGENSRITIPDLAHGLQIGSTVVEKQHLPAQIQRHIA